MQKFIELFFSNKFDDAQQHAKDGLDNHFYSHLSMSYYGCLMALITMEKVSDQS